MATEAQPVAKLLVVEDDAVIGMQYPRGSEFVDRLSPLEVGLMLMSGSGQNRLLA